MNLNRCCNSWIQKGYQERIWEDFKIWRPYNRILVHVAFEIKSDTGNNRATGTISESFRKYLSNITGITKLRNSKKKISHIEYCTRNTESDIVKVKIYFIGEITLHVTKIVNTVQLQYYYPRNIVCFKCIFVNTLH